MTNNGNAQIKNGKLSQFRPAEQNANLHTQRGLKLLTKAMGDVGYVAPITVAADGETIDGSARLETAFETFGDEALVIRHDGTKPVVMVREDIPNARTPEAKRIAYEANRIAQIDLSWDVSQLLADYESGLDLTDLWSDQEMAALLEGAADGLLRGSGANDPLAEWKGMPEFEQEAIKTHQDVIVHFMTAGDVEKFAALVEQTITENTKWIYYPKQERQKLRDLRVKSES